MSAGSAAWIDDGDKYGLVGLGVKIEGHIHSGMISPNLWVWADTTFAIPLHWQEWLGRIRAEQVESFNLFLLSKLPSQKPDIADDENEKLKNHVWRFYIGLLLASTFATAHQPIILTGSREAGEMNVSQQQDLDPPIPCLFRPYPPVLPENVQLAAQLGENIDTLATISVPGGHWRLFKTLYVYVGARANLDILDRLHQYSRCVDGLILPDVGKTRQQFKSRTELFIGPHHHDMMGEIYDIRSAVEHLHENRYLETFDRASRLDLVKKEAIVEGIARMTLARIMANRTLWPHFANTAALSRFWALTAAERGKIWGNPIDPMHAVADFDPTYISDGRLGGP